MDPHAGKQFKHWSLLVQQGLAEQVFLEPESFLTKKELISNRNKYFPKPKTIPITVTKDTVFRYPIVNGKSDIAAVYLQDRLTQRAQDEAREGFRKMKWDVPERDETATAIRRQNGYTKPGELLFGWTDQGSIEKTTEFKEQPDAWNHMGRILTEINTLYARTLPFYWGMQNRPVSDEARWLERARGKGKKPSPDYGGINENVRHGLTAFSTITCLKSCPSSLHTDRGNAPGGQPSFTALTTLREPSFKSGGQFCFLEYGLIIPVAPGDVLFGETTREWHLNITPVKGTKYSMVCYYRKDLGNPKKRYNKGLHGVVNPTDVP